MERKQMIKQIRDEEGSGLVLTLLVLLVLSVLGTSLGMATIGSYRLSDANRDDASAYYIAEAGVNMAFEEIRTNIDDLYENSTTEGTFRLSGTNKILELHDTKIEDFVKQSGEEPYALISIETHDDDKTFTIESTGNVNGKQRTVRKMFVVDWSAKGRGDEGVPSLPFEGVSVATKNGVWIDNGSLYGTVLSESEKENSIELNGSWPTTKDALVYYPDTTQLAYVANYPKNYPLPTFIPTSIKINWKKYQEILSHEFDVPNNLSKLTTADVDNPRSVLNSNGDLKLENGKGIGENYKLKVDKDIYIPHLKISTTVNLTLEIDDGNHTIVVDSAELSGAFINVKSKK